MIDGLVVVDKAEGWTSHDVVAKCRGIFGQKRVGHAGTLDPDATGVLLVGLGRVTRLLRYLSDLGKTYIGEVVLGIATSTLDASGEVVGEWDMAGVTLERVRHAAAGFVGQIQQVPPMVSAVKVGGRRLHELARAGVEVERAPRSVTVHRLDVHEGRAPGVFRLEVDCSSGTYIRSLAADLGTALGGGAHLRALRRIAVGSFSVDDAVAVGRLSTADVLPPAIALRDYPSRTIDRDWIANGRPVELDLGGPTALLDADGKLLAVYEPGGRGQAKAAVVLSG